MGRLDGRVAIVTGGAAGLGAVIVRTYAAEGARVFFGDVLVDEGERLAAAQTAAGRQVEFVRADVTRTGDVQALVDRATSAGGRLDVMTANAGILGRAHRQSLVDVAEEDVRALIDVNVLGVWRTLRSAVPALRAAGGGAITVTASTSAFRGLPKAPIYAATKAAIIVLARSLAVELAPSIRVNVVAPGAMATDLARHTAQLKGVAPGEVFAQAQPAQLADPTHAARAHLYLACDDSLGVTGEVLVVDGGAAARHP